MNLVELTLDDVIPLREAFAWLCGSWFALATLIACLAEWRYQRRQVRKGGRRGQ